MLRRSPTEIPACAGEDLVLMNGLWEIRSQAFSRQSEHNLMSALSRAAAEELLRDGGQRIQGCSDPRELPVRAVRSCISDTEHFGLKRSWCSRFLPLAP